MDLGQKVVVVTGGSRGLGLGIAKVALSAGARVAVCSRSGGELPEQARLLSEALDVRDAAAVDGFAERVSAAFGHVDLWVNNAGVLGPVGPLRDADPAGLAEAVDINVLGVMLGARAYARLCRRSQRLGVLLNISSGAGRKPYRGWSAYCASKAAVDHLSEVVAAEEVGHLRVHAVAPGVVETDMQATVRGADQLDFPDVGRFRQLHTSGGLATPEQAAEGLLKLAFEPAWETDKVCVDLRDFC